MEPGFVSSAMLIFPITFKKKKHLFVYIWREFLEPGCVPGAVFNSPISFFNSTTAGPKSGMKKEEGNMNRTYWKEFEKLKLNLTIETFSDNFYIASI